LTDLLLVQASPRPGDWSFLLFSSTGDPAFFKVNNTYVRGSSLEHCDILFGGSSQAALRAGSIRLLDVRVLYSGTIGAQITLLTPAFVGTGATMLHTATMVDGCAFSNNTLDGLTRSVGFACSASGYWLCSFAYVMGHSSRLLSPLVVCAAARPACTL
jgi:hypothetical protein